MMKRLTLFAIALLFLAACNDLPPTPPPPGVANVGGAIAGMAALPTWAAEARKAVATPSEVYFGDGVIVTVSDYDYVYKNGYYFNSQLRTWEQFTLAGEETEEWLKGQGVASIPVEGAKFAPGENYIVVYACDKTGGSWDCNNNQWMLLTFSIVGAAAAGPPQQEIDQFIINRAVNPFTVLSTEGEADNFEAIGVVRYDARYRDPGTGITVLTHVFDFNNRQEVDQTINGPFRTIVQRGWTQHNGQNLALFLDENDYRIAVWTSGKQLLYVETHIPEYAAKEVIEAYLQKYPSDLRRP